MVLQRSVSLPFHGVSCRLRWVADLKSCGDGEEFLSGEEALT